jgi:hypothetical protein
MYALGSTPGAVQPRHVLRYPDGHAAYANDRQLRRVGLWDESEAEAIRRQPAVVYDARDLPPEVLRSILRRHNPGLSNSVIHRMALLARKVV